MLLAQFNRTPLVLRCLLVAGLGSWLVSIWLVKQVDLMPWIFKNPTVGIHVSPTVRLSDLLFPIPSTVVDVDEESKSWGMANQRRLRSFFLCMETSSCAPNQDKVVILGDHYFREVMLGYIGGEFTWAGSTIEALQRLNYTYLFGLSNERIAQIYLMFPNNIVAIFMDSSMSASCFADTSNCVLSESNPGGIPAWKIFTFHWWMNPANGLGRHWTFSPDDYALEGFQEPNTYLGYTIEPACRAQSYIPPSDREHQAYILTKTLQRFVPGPERAWSPEIFDEASNMTGIRFAIGVSPNYPPVGVPELPTNYIDYDIVDRHQFMANVAKSKILIGVGNPINSPTPYEALCLGVPFLNPVFKWDRQNPSDKMKWNAQHNHLKFQDPPYVYNVFIDDREGFADAIRSALRNPIESFIPEPLKMTSVDARLDMILKTDWKSKAAELLAERKASAVGPTFTL